MTKILITLAAFLSLSCVTVGPNDTYTVDPYGAPMEAPKASLNMRPSKDELDPQPFRNHIVQFGDGVNNSMIPRIQL